MAGKPTLQFLFWSLTCLSTQIIWVVGLSEYLSTAGFREYYSFADERLRCSLGRRRQWWISYIFSSSSFIQKKKKKIVSDTLVGASIENIMIYLCGLLIMNSWVICSGLHLQTLILWTIFLYVATGAHSQEVLLGGENEWSVASTYVNLRNTMLSQNPKINTNNLQNSKCSLILFIRNQNHAEINNMLFRDTCIWNKAIIQTREL